MPEGLVLQPDCAFTLASDAMLLARRGALTFLGAVAIPRAKRRITGVAKRALLSYTSFSIAIFYAYLIYTTSQNTSLVYRPSDLLPAAIRRGASICGASATHRTFSVRNSTR